jgi:hypothetical protein
VQVDAARVGPENVGAALVILVPALLGGWLVARTGQGLRGRRGGGVTRRSRPQNASAGPGAAPVRSSERRK